MWERTRSSGDGGVPEECGRQGVLPSLKARLMDTSISLTELLSLIFSTEKSMFPYEQEKVKLYLK